jgi:molecular chaperone DnaK (HSP70)
LSGWLAIDFGTCYSSAARIVDGRAAPVKEPIEHRYSVPSSVLLTKGGERVVGYAAERRKATRPGHYQEQFKRALGRERVLLGDAEVRPEELVAEVIAFLRREAEHTGAPATEAILTIPASYEQHRRDLMLEAAAAAGFARTRPLLEEPVAAAFAREATPANELVLVYDLGGGTFDAALVELKRGKPTVLGFDGLDDVGGANFDRAIERDLAEHAGPALQQALAQLASTDEAERTVAQRAELTARDFCRRLKHDLSRLQVVDDTLLLPGEAIEYELTRDRLEELLAADLDRTARCCDDLVERCERRWEDVDGIVLVGGTCRLPFVGERLRTQFARPLQHVSDPELAVCLGAADYAQRLDRQRESERRRRAERKRRQQAEAAKAAEAAREREVEQRRDRNRAHLRRADFENNWYPRQLEFVVDKVNGTEDLLWLCRCKRFDDTMRRTALVITTEKLIWCRGTTFTTEGGTIPWASVTGVSGWSDGFGLTAPNAPRGFDGIQDGWGSDLISRNRTFRVQDINRLVASLARVPLIRMTQ